MAITISGNGIVEGNLANGAVTNTKLATGIDATKLADGTITNSELQYINSLSSNAQTQINGAGGAWKHIETIVPTATTHATFTGTPMSATYKDYMIFFSDIQGASTDKDLYMQVASGSTPTWRTSLYYSTLDYHPHGVSTITVDVGNGAQYAVAGSCYNGQGMGMCGTLYFHNITNDYVGWTCWSGNNYGSNSGMPGWGISSGQTSLPNHTSVRFHLESGINFSAHGYFALYGRVLP